MFAITIVTLDLNGQLLLQFDQAQGRITVLWIKRRCQHTAQTVTMNANVHVRLIYKSREN